MVFYFFSMVGYGCKQLGYRLKVVFPAIAIGQPVELLMQPYYTLPMITREGDMNFCLSVVHCTRKYW